ncbi:Protein of uncharacterised function (DUF3455) [Delftia tsuruhatensis]|uniref:DUF3455 domain-containing protein n=1 Tax=Delftia tsuruhatensis TaxID=180282 RepID=UPI001E76C526|nr:DUF3455 domain-containing protein [Delftia tsuruhatensis]CAB5673809.1 Protein of uncharacterised function (DUF3455) [Delftia tsuruhatensis]CAC9683728.1 Protein of uncharacterised function (DUF3455) [Delftia tsuruhatensis]
MRHHLPLGLAALATLTFSACSSIHMGGTYSQADLPAPVQVPSGHKVALETVGIGQITYECRTRKDQPMEQEWAFVGPDARLTDRQGRIVGRYFGPPATWVHQDGSKVTATQVAVAPASAGNIALQLVKAEPSSGMGALQGVTYIQRVATRGGVPPATPCNASNLGAKQVVQYQADYIIWKAA